MKKIVFFLFTLLGIYLIYNYSHQNSINYLSISDSIINNETNYNDYISNNLKKHNRLNEYNYYFVNYTASLLYQDIKKNRTIRVDNKDYYFKKSLRESDFVIVNVGMEELSNNYNKYNMKDNYDYFNKMYLDFEKLIIEIKKYAQEKIIFLGLYNPTNYYDSKVDEFFFNIDIRLNRLMANNNIVYIDLYEIVKGNNYKENNTVYLKNVGYKKISDIIMFYLET